MKTQGLRERNKIQCRKRILKSSRKLFGAKGYDETTIDDVAEMAEISKATLYNYFPNKESLLIGIAEAELEDVRHLIDTDLKAEPRGIVKLRRVLEVFVLDSVSYLSLCRKITYLNSCEDSPLYATRLDMVCLLRQLVEEAQQQGDLRGDIAVDDMADLIMGLYLMTQFEWSHIGDYSEAYRAEKFNRFFDHLLSGIQSTGHDLP